MSDSAFFTSEPYSPVSTTSHPELIHESDGGWSAVYLEDRDGRFHVLKALKERFRGNPGYEALLRKEYEIGHRLSHPNICEVHNYREVEGLGHCIEMEWVNGISLEEMLARGPVTRNLSLRIIRQLCDALAYCHSCQVLHRDIKPGNIMLTHGSNDVKLIDFGLSDSDTHSIFKSACGSTLYSAPEVLEGAVPDIRSDIFSLGKVIALLHPSFSRIAGKCTKKDPRKRYPDADSVKSAANSVRKLKALQISAAAAALLLAISAPVTVNHLRRDDTSSYRDVPQELPVPVPTGNEQSGNPDISDNQEYATATPPSGQTSRAEAASRTDTASSSVQDAASYDTPQETAPAKDNAGYGTDDIDELFKMATELLDKHQ